MSKTILYARVSTVDQTTAIQRQQAEADGFAVDEVIEDEGVSGVNTLFADRPGGALALRMLRAGDILLVRWLDRLGRNYQDVTGTLRALLAKGVIVKTIINRMTFDGAASDPMQMAVRDALIGFMAAMAQAQAEATKEAQKAGIAHARASEPEKYRGRRPTIDRAEVRRLKAEGKSPTEISKALRISRESVYAVLRESA